MNRTINHYMTACGRDATIRIIDSYHISCGCPRDADHSLDRAEQTTEANICSQNYKKVERAI